MFRLAGWKATALAASLSVMLLAAVVSGIWWHGRLHERGLWQQRQAALVAERRVQGALIIGAVEENARLRAERAALATELEEAAHADDNADRPALGPDSVRRLNRR